MQFAERDVAEAGLDVGGDEVVVVLEGGVVEGEGGSPARQPIVESGSSAGGVVEAAVVLVDLDFLGADVCGCWAGEAIFGGMVPSARR